MAKRRPPNWNLQQRSMSSPTSRSSENPPNASKSSRRTARFAPGPAGRNPICSEAADRTVRGVRPLRSPMSKTPATTSALAKPVTQALNHPGCTSSSASQKASRSPAACAAPMLRAAAGPRRADASTSRILASRAVQRSTSWRVPSVDPLSATTTSQGSSHCCLERAASWDSSQGHPLSTGMTTLITSEES